MDPRIIIALAKLGLDAGRLGKDLADRVDKLLRDKYRFDRPRKFPRLGFGMFKEVRTATLGGHQYVLERGRFVGRVWRIREKMHPLVTAFFVWDTYESESSAIEQWESFIALVEARHALASGAPGK
jgi:hypothetical protein